MRQSKQVSPAERAYILRARACVWCMCYLIDTFLNVKSIRSQGYVD